MIIAVDFDGTCVRHKYPDVGEDVSGAVATLRRLCGAGHELILYTMRSGESLLDAVTWFNDRGIPLWGINGNSLQSEWTSSPKVYAHLYIDDAALGCPLKTIWGESRPAVNWKAVESMLEERGIL